MQGDYSFTLKRIKIPLLGLLAIAATLLAIHLTLHLKEEKYAHLALSVAFWSIAGLVIWNKREQIESECNLFSFCLGGVIIAGILFKSLSLPSSNFLGFAPVIIALGLALVTSGIGGLKNYRRELLILFCLGAPRFVMYNLPDISPLTAGFSFLVLLSSGFDVAIQNVTIALPNGAVEVVAACSGMNLVVYMLGLAVAALAISPTTWQQKIILPIVAAITGFVVNGLRVALLAVFSSPQHEHAFHFWHSQEGSLIVVGASIVLFGLLCPLLLTKKKALR